MTKVYILGNKTFGGVVPEFDDGQYEIDFNNFPHDKLTNLESLTEYPIIIVDYDAFYISGTKYQEYQNLFSKQLTRALMKGAYVVFVHYDERYPKKIKNTYDDNINEMVTAEYIVLDKEQIGFKFMNEAGSSLRPINTYEPFNHSKTKLHHFENYLDTWGSSHLFFKDYGDKNLIPIQETSSGDLLSFAKRYSKGKLVYLACQRNSDDVDNTNALIKSLIKAVDSYKAHSYTEMPSWAAEPLFDKEGQLVKENDELSKRIDANNKLLEPYVLAKRLAFLSDDDFKDGLVKFLQEQLGLKITSIEKYKEDFLIHGDKETILGICEAKAINGGITKGAVYQLYNNREEQGYDEKTLGLVFVSSHLKGSSWNERDKNVDAKAYKAAASENILIVRLIDLLRLWDMVESSKLTKEEAMDYLLSNKGWLKVADNDDISIMS